MKISKVLLLFITVAAALFLSACAGGDENTGVIINGVSAAETSQEVGLEVTFTVDFTEINTKVAKVVWDFDDGATAEGTTVSHTFCAGTFFPKVFVYDEDGRVYFANAKSVKVPAKLLLLVYMGADTSNMTPQVPKDLAEMENADPFPKDVAVVCFVDTIQTDGVRYYQVLPKYLKTLQTLPEQNSGSILTFKNFLEWAKQNFSFERVMIVLWDHGTGWYPYTRSSPFTRAIVFDDYSHSALELSEVAEAISDVFTKVDVLGFDACLMGLIETGSVFKSVASYVVASELEEPLTGWNYELFLEKIANLEKSAYQVAKAAVDAYKETYSTYTLMDCSLAVYDMSYWANLEHQVSNWASKLAQLYSDDFDNRVMNPFSEDSPTYNVSVSSPSLYYFDLEGLARIWVDATNTAGATSPDITNAVPYRWTSDTHNWCGVGITVPATDEVTTWCTYFEDVMPGWASLIKRIRGITE